MKKMLLFPLVMVFVLLLTGCSQTQISPSLTNTEYPKKETTKESNFLEHFTQVSKMDLKIEKQTTESSDPQQIQEILRLLNEVQWKTSFYAESKDLASQSKKGSLGLYAGDHLIGMVMITKDNQLLFMDVSKTSGSASTYVSTSDATAQIEAILAWGQK